MKAVVVAIALLLPVPLQAQDIVVRGRLLGPDGTALAAERVLLHRVDQSGGATIAEDTSGADGAFALNTTPSDTSAVYFVAARYQDELYIGQMFRVAGRDTIEQSLQVGVANTSASALLAGADQAVQTTGRPATPRSWLLLIVPLLGVSAAVLYMLLPRRKIAPERAQLIRIAQIDERIDAAPPGQRDSMRAERNHLVEQLRTG